MKRGSLSCLALMLLPACQSDDRPATDLAALKDESPAATAPAPRVEPSPVDWAAFEGCEAQLRELVRLERRGALPDDPQASPFGVVVGAPVGRDRLSSPAVPIKADLPIPVNTAAARAAPCVIRVGLAHDLEARRRIVGQESVESEYQIGVRREDNPAYDIAKLKVDRAKRRSGEDIDVWGGVGDPMIDLIGLLVGGLAAGFTGGSAEKELDAAMLELAETPRKIDEPVYAPYHFDRVLVDAAKRAKIPLELIEGESTTRRITIAHSEQRRFYVPQALSRRDRNYKEHMTQSITKRGLTEWQRTPPELSLSHAVAALLGERRRPDAWSQVEPKDTRGGPALPDELDGPDREGPDGPLMIDEADGPALDRPPATNDWSRPGDRSPPDSDDLIMIEREAERTRLSADYGRPFIAFGRSRLTERAAVEPSDEVALADDEWHDPFAPRRRKPPYGQAADLSADPRFASVVMVKRDGMLGSGFYVQPDLVVTNYHVVEGANVVDLVALDGITVPGMVLATDVGRDLALVHSPHPGRPAPLYAGAPLKPGLEVEAIGSPHGFDFTLTRGIVSAVRTRPSLLAPSLQKVRYVQTDTDINPGNSGGPLFLDGDVVGVSDWGRRSVSGGLNFAIHVDELRDFLAEEDVALGKGAP